MSAAMQTARDVIAEALARGEVECARCSHFSHPHEQEAVELADAILTALVERGLVLDPKCRVVTFASRQEDEE